MGMTMVPATKHLWDSVLCRMQSSYYMLHEGCLLLTSVCWFHLEVDRYSAEQYKRNVRCWHWEAIYNLDSSGEEAEFPSHVDLDSPHLFSVVW